jgi:hypothetical protein
VSGAGVRPRRARPGVRLPLVAAALGSVMALGCASEATLIREDPGFTAAALKSGGLAVLGVVQVDEVPQARPPLVDALQRVLSGARRDIPLVPAARVQAALGDSTTRLLLLGYQLRGDPDSIWLARAAESARPLAHYGMLARVRETRVRYGTREIPTSQATGMGEGAVRVTGRDVQVEVTVYDLATRATVYRAKFAGTYDAAPTFRPPPADTLNPDSVEVGVKQRTDRPSQTFRPGTGGFAIPGPSDSPSDLGYPEPPPVARASESAFLGFARALPGGPPAAK